MTEKRKSMLERLSAMEQRFEELSRLIEDPDVISKDRRYPTYVRERGALVKTVEKYRELLACRQAIAEAEEILAGSDKELQAMATEEIEEQQAAEEAALAELRGLFVTADTDGARNVIVEIRAGTGGDEAALFAGDLFRMYARYAELKAWKVEVMDQSKTELKGFKEITFSVSGVDVYKHLRYESGGHRVQRVPKTEAQGRVHTSAATVAVFPEADEVEVEINQGDLRIDVFRASGPGGQHVNKTSSSVRITHIPTNTAVVCQDERSQHKNKAKAMRILRSRLYESQKAKEIADRDASRRSQVGTGDRSDKIRTYNFPQNRVTDHRYGISIYRLDTILLGQIDEFLTKVIEAERDRKLEELE